MRFSVFYFLRLPQSFQTHFKSFRLLFCCFPAKTLGPRRFEHISTPRTGARQPSRHSIDCRAMQRLLLLLLVFWPCLATRQTWPPNQEAVTNICRGPPFVQVRLLLDIEFVAQPKVANATALAISSFLTAANGMSHCWGSPWIGSLDLCNSALSMIPWTHQGYSTVGQSCGNCHRRNIHRDS